MEIPLKSQPKVSMVDLKDDRYRLDEYKLSRTYSDSQVDNYDEDTGTIRKRSANHLYTQSHRHAHGIEDEYIPGLDFSDMVVQWNDTPELSRTNSTSSYLDLGDLHAKVMPQRIQKAAPRKKFKSSSESKSASEFDVVLGSLPSNFSDLPYSQRKRLVKSINDSIDYSQFASYVKSYFGKPTLAGRLLSSTTDLKQLAVDVNERGARVMGCELGRVIGFGAWGTIRECVGDEPLAMKIVTNKKPELLDLFRQEIAIWKSLHHPHVLELIRWHECADTIFCLMPRVNGGTLFDVVSRWGVSEAPDRRRTAITAAYARQVAEAVAYLHGEGVVHGDLKLENVLVQKDSEDELTHQMVVCDFGMSRVYRRQSEVRSKSSMSEIRKPYEGESLNSRRLVNLLAVDEFRSQSRPSSPTRMFRRRRASPDQHRSDSRDHSPERKSRHSSYHSTNSLESIKQFLQDLKQKEMHRQSQVDLNLPDSHIGSLPYASPELLLPNPPPLGPSADIWALGVLIYTMVLGKLPFHHSYEPRLRAMIISGRYKMDGDMTSAELSRIIGGCLEMDITKRLDIDTILAILHDKPDPLQNN